MNKIFFIFCFCLHTIFINAQNTTETTTISKIDLQNFSFDYSACNDKDNCLNALKKQISHYILKNTGDGLLDALPEIKNKKDSTTTKTLKLTYWLNEKGFIETSLFGSNIKSNKPILNQIKQLLSKVNIDINKSEYLDIQDLNKQYFHYVHLKNSISNEQFSIYTPKKQPELNFAKDSLTPPVMPRCRLKKRQLKNKTPKEIYALQKKCLEENITKIVSSNFSIKTMNNSLKNLKDNYNIGKKTPIKTIVSFKFDKAGKVSDIESLGIVPELEKESIRVIKKTPTVIPGTQKGKVVSVLYTIPITFRIK